MSGSGMVNAEMKVGTWILGHRPMIQNETQFFSHNVVSIGHEFTYHHDLSSK